MAKCAETAGFLISAPCKQPADGKCQSCRKPVCRRHQRKSAAGDKTFCITCYRRSSDGYGDTDDPYLYSGIIYTDYYEHSYYRDDWEGSEVFMADDTDWEADFDGS